MSHIFISYSRQDSAIVLKVARQIEAQGYRVWVDVTSIPGGEDWAREIQKGLTNAAVMLLFWSQNANQSDYVRQEYQDAISLVKRLPAEKRRIIPVMLEPFTTVPLPADLQGTNFVSLVNHSDTEIDELIRALPSEMRARQIITVDRNRKLGDYSDAKPLDTLAELVRVPFMQSVYCHAELIGKPDITLNKVLEAPHPKVQLLLNFTGPVGDSTVGDVYRLFQPEDPFLMLRVIGLDDGANYLLRDSQTGRWQGEWLDPVNATVEAVQKWVDRDKITIQLFVAALLPLAFAIGRKFERYWHFEIYHRTRDGRYQLVLNTRDL
jgi:hypothetical protein